MEEDLVAAKKRETRAQGAARRRARWLRRKGWRRSAKGNVYIRVDGYHITIFRRGGGYRGVISNPSTGFEYFGKRTFPSEAAAQLASFDALEFLKSQDE